MTSRSDLIRMQEALEADAAEENIRAVEALAPKPVFVDESLPPRVKSELSLVKKAPPTVATSVRDEEPSFLDDVLAVPSQIISGPLAAIGENFSLARTGIDYAAEHSPAFDIASNFVDSFEDVIETHFPEAGLPEPKGPISSTVRFVTQFMAAAYLPAKKIKLAKAMANAGSAGGAANAVARSGAVSAVAGATGFAPDVPNAGNLIRDLSKDSETLQTAFGNLPRSLQNIIRQLPNEPDDSELVARLKNGAAEALFGLPFDAVMALARVYRATSHAKKLDAEKQDYATSTDKGSSSSVREDLKRSEPKIVEVSDELAEETLTSGKSVADTVKDKALEKGVLRSAGIRGLRPDDVTRIGLKPDEKTGLFDGAERFVDVESMVKGGKTMNLKELKLDFSSVKDSGDLIKALKASIAGIERQITGKLPGAPSHKLAAKDVFEKALAIAESGPEGITTAFEAALKSTNRTELDAIVFDIARAHHGNRTFALMQKTLSGDILAASELPRQLAIGAEIEALSRVVKSPLKKHLLNQFDLSKFGFGKNFNQEASDMLARNAKFIDDFDSADLAARLNTIPNKAAFKKLTQQSSRSGKFGAFLEYYYNAILSSSIVPNFLSSHAFLVYQMPVRTLAGVFGTAENLAKGKFDASPLVDSMAFAAGYARSFINNITTLGKNLGRSAMTLEPKLSGAATKFESFTEKAISAKTFSVGIEAVDKAFRTATREGISIKTPLEMLTNATGRITRMTQNMFASADEFNRRIAYDADRWSRGHRDLFSTPDAKKAIDQMNAGIEHAPGEGLDETAEEFAKFITFTREAELTGGLRDAIAEYPVFRVAMPFLRSQADMFSATVANSPMAVLSPTFKQAMQAGGVKRQIALSQLTLGSALTYSLYEGFIAGKITDNGPSDHAEKALMKKVGWEPLSILVSGDSPATHMLKMASGRDDLFDRELVPPVYVSLKDAQPFATWLGFVGDSLRAMRRMDDPAESDNAFKVIYEDVASNILNKNFSSGLFNIVGAFAGGRDPTTILPNLMASLAPAAVADFNQSGRKSPIDFNVVDPTQSAEHQFAVKLFQKFKFRWGFDDDAIPNFDGLGQVGVRPENADGSYFNIDISGKMTQRYSDVYAHLLNNRVFPEKLKPEITMKGATIPLTLDQYKEYQEIYGNEDFGSGSIMEGLRDLVDDSRFADASDGVDGVQKDILRNYIESYKHSARAVLIDNNEDLQDKLEAEFERMQDAAYSDPTANNFTDPSLRDILGANQ